ncbi:MAG: periplasmic heavy metal sensor [Desulfobacterales bacterium]
MMKARNAFMILALAAIVGLGTYAWAGKGDGGRGPDGYGRGMDRGAWALLSDEEAQKASEERQAFFDATRQTRRSIHQKRLELASEMAKEAVDEPRVKALQKEISDLNAELDQERLQHRLRMKSISPDLAGGPGSCLRGGGTGYGQGMHRGMGRGMRGGGSGGCYGAGRY